MKRKKGTYRGKKIIAYLNEDGAVQRYCYCNDLGNYYFPLIENGENVDKSKFDFSNEQLSLFSGVTQCNG